MRISLDRLEKIQKFEGRGHGGHLTDVYQRRAQRIVKRYGKETDYERMDYAIAQAMAKDEPDFISSDCALAGHHIAQGMAQAGTPAKALQHPLSLVRHAYGL